MYPPTIKRTSGSPAVAMWFFFLWCFFCAVDVVVEKARRSVDVIILVQKVLLI